MHIKTVEQLAQYITDQGIIAVREYTNLKDVVIDYLAIFAKDNEEYTVLNQTAAVHGKVVDKAMSHTGNTYYLTKPVQTKAGMLQILKIRKPDKTRPQRGAPDFQVENYTFFKENHLYTSGNFTLMVRKDYEMIELKGEDVLVYFPSRTFEQRNAISNQTTRETS